MQDMKESKKKEVFSIAKFYYDLLEMGMSFREIKRNLKWANYCHGKEVLDGRIGKYLIAPEWCKEI